jgi:hypothetical protein
MVRSYDCGSDLGGWECPTRVWIEQGLQLQVGFYTVHRKPVSFFGEGASVIFVKQAGESSRLVRRD